MTISRHAIRRALARLAATGILPSLVAFGMPPAEAATPAIGSGVRHSVALGADGRVRTWGNDETGVLGVDRRLWSCPAAVPGVTGATGISAGLNHVLVLRGDRTVLAWGDNDTGQLGDGSNTRSPTPIAVPGLTAVVQVSAGVGYSMARTADGRVWEWGYPATSVPRRVEGLDDVVEIAAGFGFQLARRGDGSVWAWGSNEFGQLGDGTTTRRLTPSPVQGLANVAAISAGTDFALALLADGTLWGWGSNQQASLGDGSRVDRLRPVRVQGVSAIVAIEAGHGPAFAIRSDGAVFGWGRNGQNQLGLNTYEDQLTPIPLPGLAGATAVSQGLYHAVARMPDGTLLGWGVNGKCALGDVALRGVTPGAPAGISGVATVSAGDEFTVALRTDGSVWTFGDNARGQLGNTQNPFRTTPSLVAITEVERIASGWYHVTALKSDGSVWAWGGGIGGVIGDGSDVDRATPVAVSGFGPGSGVRDLAAGARFMLARKADGSVWSWGYNYESQLGPRESRDERIPSRMTAFSDAMAIAAGGSHSLAIRSDGTVWAWGHNYYGQLGDGARTPEIYGSGRLEPMPVPGMSGARLIAGGHAHSVVLKADGTLWAWGRNNSGQLGDGTQTDRLSPVRIASGLDDIAAISAGGDYTMLLKRDGSVWAWGAGYQPGGAQVRPAPVPGLSGIAALAAGHHTLALTRDGSVLAWGYNATGQIGDGTLVARPLPVVVLREGGGGSVASNDWFLDLDPALPSVIPAGRIPVFLVVAASAGGQYTAALRFRQEDVGSTGSVFVFALAPAAVVKTATDGSRPVAMGKAASRNGAKAGESDCVLAQPDASGQLIALTAAQLQAYQSGVLSAQGASVAIINTSSASSAPGATFYVGYGASGTTMVNNGVYRSVVNVPGNLSCTTLASPTALWWDPAENGWGVNFAHQGNTLFATLFTYDANRAPMWLVMSNGTLQSDGVTFTGDLYRTTGPAFNAVPFTPVTDANLTRVGTMTATFSDVNAATLRYSVDGVEVRKAIQRLVFGSRAASCLATTASRAAATNYQDLWWNTAESGWGINVTHQDNTLFATLFNYDASGRGLWLVMSEGSRQADGSYQGPLYRASGPPFDANPFTPITAADLANVGTMRFAFTDGERGTLTYSVNGIPVTKAITRLVFASPPSVCN